MREIGWLEAACSEEEMLPFLARVEWKREERRNGRESKVMLWKIKAMVLLEGDRRGGQRTHEVWKEEATW